MGAFGFTDAFGLILIIGGIIYSFIAYEKGVKTCDSWANWLPAAGPLLFAFLMIWLGVQMIG